MKSRRVSCQPSLPRWKVNSPLRVATSNRSSIALSSMAARASAAAQGLHHVDLAVRRQGIAETGTVAQAQTVDEDGQVPTQAALVIQQVAAQFRRFDEHRVEGARQGIGRQFALFDGNV